MFRPIVGILTVICFHIGWTQAMGTRICDIVSVREASRLFSYEYYMSARNFADERDNIFLAPTTAAIGLAMIHAGSGGRTRNQILDGLQLTSTSRRRLSHDDVPCLHIACTPDFSEEEKSGDKKNVILQNAARIYGEETCSFRREFISATRKYGQKMKKISFSEDPSGSRKVINRWVSKMTNHTIKDLFSHDDIDSSTRLAFVSVIYFQAPWRRPFVSSGTGKFQVDDTKQLDVKYMTLKDDIHTFYSDDLAAELIELPYGDRGDHPVKVSMIILKPRLSISDLESRLTDHNMDRALSQLFTSYSDYKKVKMPKIHITGKYNLEPILSDMGMTDMFDVTAANLSGMVENERLFISTAVQKTSLKVDESGTEASGASGSSARPKMAVPVIEVNRAFITLIYEKNSKTVLFIGRIMDPTSG